MSKAKRSATRLVANMAQYPSNRLHRDWLARDLRMPRHRVTHLLNLAEGFGWVWKDGYYWELSDSGFSIARSIAAPRPEACTTSWNEFNAGARFQF